MGTKYPNAAIVGYNANPPSDDGLRASTNEVLWQKHKNKLADPVKTLTELIDTQFLVHTDESVLNIATNTTTTNPQHKRTLNVTNGSTISLASSVTLVVGWLVQIRNSHTVAITVDLANAADTLDNVVGGSTTIEPGRTKMFIRNVGGDGFFSLVNDKTGSVLPETTVLKTLDESVVSNNTPFTNDDDELFFAADANSVYVIRMCIYATDGTGGINFWIDNTDGTRNNVFWHGAQTEGVEPSQGLFVNGTIQTDEASGSTHLLNNFSPGPARFWFSGLVITPGSAGNIQFGWVQNNSSVSATTVKAGSCLIYTKVA